MAHSEKPKADDVCMKKDAKSVKACKALRKKTPKFDFTTMPKKGSRST